MKRRIQGNYSSLLRARERNNAFPWRRVSTEVFSRLLRMRRAADVERLDHCADARRNDLDHVFIWRCTAQTQLLVPPLSARERRGAGGATRAHRALAPGRGTLPPERGQLSLSFLQNPRQASSHQKWQHAVSCDSLCAKHWRRSYFSHSGFPRSFITVQVSGRYIAQCCI